MRLITDAAQSQAMAQLASDDHGAYLVPAFTGLGAPHWDPDARGALLGLTLDSRPEDVVRAALESVAYQTRDLMAAMIEDGAAAAAGKPPTDVRVDGGMVVNDWMCQFLADMVELPVERPSVTETTALGAAYLAGMAAGVYGSLDDIAAIWALDRRFEPTMASDRRGRLYAGWQKAVRQTLTS